MTNIPVNRQPLRSWLRLTQSVNEPRQSRHWLILLALCCATFIVGLSGPALTDSDEAFYAESAREMIDRSDWLTPYFNGVTRFEKPVLYYWMAAFSYTVAGISTWAARLPSALAGMGLVFVAYIAARRWYDDTTAFYAGLIVATSFGSIAMAHQALPDLPLALFISVAVWGAYVGLLSNPSSKAPAASRKPWLIVSAVGAACAFLVKGPVGIALLLSVLLPLSAIEWVFFKRVWQVRLTDIAIATTVGLAITVPWYLAMTMEHGVAYLERFFITENLERFATTRYNAPRPMWYYGPIVIGGLLPWSLFSPLCIRQLLSRRTTWQPDIPTLRIGLWALMPLIFYSFSIGKQPRYVLPVLIPLSIFLAHGIVSALRDPTSKARSFGISCLACGCTMLAIAALIYRAQPLLVSTAPTILLASTIALGLSGLLISAAALSYIRTRSRSWGQTSVVLIVMSVVVLNLAAHHGVLASNGNSEVQQMAAMIRAERTNNEPYGRHRVFNRNLVYYVQCTHVELPVIRAVRDFLRSPDRVFCVLRKEDATMLAQDGVAFRELGALRYFNTGSLTLRMLLNPNADRYLSHVVLISNQ